MAVPKLPDGFELLKVENDFRYLKKDGREYEIPCQADIATWSPLTRRYSKDKRALYFDASVCHRKYFSKIDFGTLAVVASDEGADRHFFKDRKNVYHADDEFAVLAGADPETFRVVDLKKDIAADKGGAYYGGSRLPYTLEQLEQGKILGDDDFAVAGGKVYFAFSRELKGADAASFALATPSIPKRYTGRVGKDKNRVYLMEEASPDADPATFHFLPECLAPKTSYRNDEILFYAADKNNAYFVRTLAHAPLFKRIRTKNPAAFTFEVVDKIGYGVDGEDRYLDGVKMKR